MELADHSAFLVLTYSPQAAQRFIRVVPSLEEALLEWSPSTRISPLFGLKDRGTGEIDRDSFAGNHTLFFIGPTEPTTILDSLVDYKAWLTLGTFNVLLDASSEAQRKAVSALLRKHQFRFERWTVRDAAVIDWEYTGGVLPESKTNWRATLARLAALPVAPELREAVSEYCPLMASALARAGEALPFLLDDLLSVHRFVDELAREHVAAVDDVEVYEKLGLITTITAALARFTSQTLSGSSPIFETECHFWIHSLLGTGVANLALLRLRTFVQVTVGENRIPQRLEKLKEVTDELPDLMRLPASDPFWHEDHIGKVQLSAVDLREPLYPLLTYFSGRDGFRSTLNTLSAPLIVISSCNSSRWTLMTLTHEISHDVIRGVLSVLYPDCRKPREISRALKLLSATGLPPNLLEAIRLAILRSLIAMQQKEEERTDSRTVTFDARNLILLLDRWHNEVEEILAHVFDLLYFHGRDIEKYIAGIWMSWSVIPNIGNRVPEYVLRTLCATLALHLRRGKRSEEICRDQVVRVLRDLQAQGEGGPYVQAALTYLEEQWELEIKGRLVVRKKLVQLVTSFLYSEAVASALLGETKIVGKRSKRAGYPLVMRRLQGIRVDNPFHFIGIYTEGRHPIASHAAWLLYVLAFDVKTGDRSWNGTNI